MALIETRFYIGRQDDEKRSRRQTARPYTLDEMTIITIVRGIRRGVIGTKNRILDVLQAPSPELQFLFLLICYDSLRLKVTIDVILSPAKAVHGDPMTQSFQLLPNLGIAFLDPSLDACLSIVAGGRVHPATQATQCYYVMKMIVD